jgi:hypothetical protein
VRDLLGHCDLAMVSRYVHSMEEGRIAAVRRASIGRAGARPKVVQMAYAETGGEGRGSKEP